MKRKQYNLPKKERVYPIRFVETSEYNWSVVDSALDKALEKMKKTVIRSLAQGGNGIRVSLWIMPSK